MPTSTNFPHDTPLDARIFQHVAMSAARVVVLRCILHHGPVTWAQIVETTGLPGSTVSKATSELLAHRLITQDEAESRKSAYAPVLSQLTSLHSAWASWANPAPDQETEVTDCSPTSE